MMDNELKTSGKSEVFIELTKNMNFNHCCELIAELLIKYNKIYHKEEHKEAAAPEEHKEDSPGAFFVSPLD